MTDRQIQFRVGLFVISALLTGAGMIFQFGQLENLWKKKYTIAMRFESISGVHRGTPVVRHGIRIGEVDKIITSDSKPGVVLLVKIDETQHLRKDASPQIVTSIMGDSKIVISPGVDKKFLEPGERLIGQASTDPMEVVYRMEQQVSKTLSAFTETSQEWGKLAGNMNRLLETKEGNIDVVVERAATSLEEFSQAMRQMNAMMKNVNMLVADPQQQENLKRSLAAMPAMIESTQRTISSVEVAVQKAGQNLDNLSRVTDPLAKHSQSMVVKLDRSLSRLDAMMAELNSFTRALNQGDGSLKKFISDPDLYRNMNRSASSLTVLLNNLEPIARDIRIFSDRIARHPEILGVSGAMKGSSGIKESGEQPSRVRQSGYSFPATKQP
ncbi:MlaD family protein [Gimesia chilikensis]|jgi:phospholipid/cholesterol/gamma-HCH transport system substrate-binding protein|uniref:MlaD family protein n=1 Tax=Gimesia chilikensis TaxID=2605989 RepID=UPI00118D5807|nr:MlaD family protein [Gimesia chilikensis]MCR9230877.1 MlaD family protein [bacterium]QDT83699.1 mce related protein [Gimesia chilikensis]